MATSILPANSETQVIKNSSGGKRLVKSKSGLKIVCQHDRESAPWDMAEPQWTPDKEVTYFVTTSKLSFLSYFNRFRLKFAMLICYLKRIS